MWFEVGVGKMDKPVHVKKLTLKLYFTPILFSTTIFEVVYVCPNTDIYVSDIDYMYILFENASEVDFFDRNIKLFKIR